jgi:hypothetical protein
MTKKPQNSIYFVPQVRKCAKFPYWFYLWFKSIFSECFSIFNNLFIIDQNIMKPIWCTPIHVGLSNGTKSLWRSTMVLEISMWQITKQNKIHSFINRYFAHRLTFFIFYFFILVCEFIWKIHPRLIVWYLWILTRKWKK